MKTEPSDIDEDATGSVKVPRESGYFISLRQGIKTMSHQNHESAGNQFETGEAAQRPHYTIRCSQTHNAWRATSTRGGGRAA